MAAENKENSDDDFLATAKKRFQLAQEAENDQRVLEIDDMNFRAGNQWPEAIRNKRENDGKPCLTINRIPAAARQVTNDQRQNRPSIKVNPASGDASIETAEVFQGLIRHIEYNSNADVAYDTSFEGAVNKGRGYFRIITDYCDPKSFNQELLIKRVPNSHSVYLDPNYQEPDASDANWGWIFENMSNEDYKAQYPDSKLSSMADWEALGDQSPGWIEESTCRVAEYFYKTFKEVKLVLVSDAHGNQQVIEKSKLPEDFPKDQILKERKVILPAIKWCKMNAVEKLEETDWLGQWIPIIPVVGDELNIDGKRIFEGIIRQAKDPQRMSNYWRSAATEMIALAPRAPYIGHAGQFENFENQWKTANTDNHAYLEVNPVMINGAAAPLPQRNVYEPPVQAIMQVNRQSDDDIKAVTGIFDASLGNRSNENSGVAIQRRNVQAQTGNFHFMDNLTRAMRHAGRILVDLIPQIYDTPQVIRILGEDGQPEMVAINQMFTENGKEKIHDFSVGKYDVTVSTGPSFQTKRQEAAETMLEFTKSVPTAAPLVADLIARNMDWPGSDEMADRLKKALPPGIGDDDKDKQMPVPPQVQKQMQEQGQMIDQLTEHLKAKTDLVNQKTLEIESKERIEMAKIQADIEIEMAKMGSAEAQTLLKAEVGAIQHRLDLLQMNQPIETEADAGPETGAQPPEQQQPPTGGPSPGTPMGV